VLGERRLALEPRSFPSDEPERSLALLSRADVPTGGAETSVPVDALALRRENEALKAELVREHTARLEREREWLAYNRTLAKMGFTPRAGAFGVDLKLVPEAAEAEAEGEPQPPATPTAEPDPAAARAEELARAVRAFLVLADLKSYDLIDAGGLVEDPPYRGIGPVVFRLLDDRGRLAGGLFAKLLRMEGSRSGRTVTLILSDGYESHGGRRTPFESGVLRIPVPFLDPEPWFEECPELFPEKAFADVEDDGLWDREALRRALNRLLALDTGAGWYRLRGIGGVVRDQLTDVQLEELDSGGRLTRRLFADRMRMRPEPPGVVLLLENGVVVRGDEKEPFREGSYRIYLPRAAVEEWRDAAMPGFEGEGNERQG